MWSYRLVTITAMVLSSALFAAAQGTTAPRSQPLPRTADGKPNLEGIWQAASTAAADLQSHVASLNMLAGRSVVAGNEIPYQPWAAKQKAENFQNRQTADPFSKCYIPGVPRIMYLDFPFQIFQTPKIDRDGLRMGAGLPLDLHRRHSSPRGREFLDGRFPRPLGGRHTGGRRRRHQRQNLVRHGGGLSQ